MPVEIVRSAHRPAYIRQRNRIGFIFFVPVLLHLSVFLLAPVVTAVIYSFARYEVLTPARFVGFSNFRYLWNNPSFWNSLEVTGRYVLLRVSFLMVFAFIMAFITSANFTGRGFFQTTYFLPYVFPLPVTAILWTMFYRPRGLLEQVLAPLGVPLIPWLSSSDTALIGITIATVWSAAGYYSVLILAGLQTISTDQIEAAMVDGASALRRFVSVILPGLKPTMFYVILVSVINTIRGFPPHMIMTGGGPGEATRVVGLYMYQLGFTRLRMGLASAVTVVFLAIVLLFAVVVRWLFEGREEER